MIKLSNVNKGLKAEIGRLLKKWSCHYLYCEEIDDAKSEYSVSPCKFPRIASV